MEYGSDYSIDLGNLKYDEDNTFCFLSKFNTLYFDSGRSAIRYLLNSIQHSKVALPDYLCEAIIDCFPESIPFYYSIDAKLQIKDIDCIPWEEIDMFYLLHYFGSIQPEDVLNYILEKKKQYGFIIIEDTTHSVFTQTCTIGDYCVCSLRKWFPIPDGGVLYSMECLNSNNYDALVPITSDRIDGMVLKSQYLKGNISDKEAFRKILKYSEDRLDQQKCIYKLSAISEHILKCYNVKKIVNRRKKNHTALKEAIGYVLPEVQERSDSDVPFVYVTRSNDRDELRSYLIQEQVYCPIHWPLPRTWGSEIAVDLSEKLISIPIDQRYSVDEVRNVAKVIRGFYNE